MNEIKSGKAPGLDGFPVECLKKGGLPMDWHGACTKGLMCKWTHDKGTKGVPCTKGLMRY